MFDAEVDREALELQQLALQSRIDTQARARGKVTICHRHCG
jgi:hypothetical protein